MKPTPQPSRNQTPRQNVDLAKHALLAEFASSEGDDNEGPLSAAITVARKYPVAVGAAGLVSFLLFRKSAVAKAVATAAITRLAVAGVKRLK